MATRSGGDPLVFRLRLFALAALGRDGDFEQITELVPRFPHPLH